VIRDGIVVHTGILGSLKRFKDDVREVKNNYECGLNIDKFNDIKIGDIVEAFEEVEVARKLGYTETIMGRRRYFPDLTNPDRQRREMAERMALNAPIQGSAADIVKNAMLNADSLLKSEKLQSRLLLQVHDELVFEVAKGEKDQVEKLARTAMAKAASLLVPLDVSIGVGSSWDEAAH
jgi:DNA polymerase-1